MAESCGHGRVSRPENFTTRAASHRLKQIGEGGEDGRRRRDRHSPEIDEAIGVAHAGSFSGASGRRADLCAQHAC